MEEKELNISFNKSGRGSITPRVILPISWTKRMDLDGNNKATKATYGHGKIVIEKSKKWEEDLNDQQKLVLNKIKLMELALLSEQPLKLMGEAMYSFEGELTNFRLFLCDPRETMYICSKCDCIYGFLSPEQLDYDIDSIKNDFCKCSMEYRLDSAFGKNEGCKCEIPDRSKLEEIYYKKLITYVEQRRNEILEKINN